MTWDDDPQPMSNYTVTVKIKMNVTVRDAPDLDTEQIMDAVMDKIRDDITESDVDVTDVTEDRVQ